MHRLVPSLPSGGLERGRGALKRPRSSHQRRAAVEIEVPPKDRPEQAGVLMGDRLDSPTEGDLERGRSQ